MDPYSTPEPHQTNPISHPNNQLREIVIAWERLRVLYNLILLVSGIASIIICINLELMRFEETIPLAIIFALFANTCFLAGPTAETYIRVIMNAQPSKSLRLTLFTLGTLLSLIPCIATPLALSLNLLPTP